MTSMTYDLPLGVDPPLAGDLIRSPRLRYRITEVRPVDSRVWENRWKLTLESLGPHGDAPWAENEYGLRRYRRGEGPEDLYGDQLTGDPESHSLNPGRPTDPKEIPCSSSSPSS